MALSPHTGMGLILNPTRLEHVNLMEAKDSLGMNGLFRSQKSERQV